MCLRLLGNDMLVCVPVNLLYVSGNLSLMCFHIFVASLCSTMFNGSILFCS